MTTQDMPRHNRRQIVGAIATKDIADGWRNRTLVGIVLAVLATLLTAQALPLLLGLGGRQNVIVVAGRGSELTTQLAENDTLRVSRRTTAAAAQEETAESSAGVLGITLTEDVEQRLLAGEAVTLEAFTAYATSDAQLAKARAVVAQAIRDTTGAEVTFAVRTLYPGPQAGGRPIMAVSSLLLIALVPGMLVVPLLIMEEKETHTLDALLVSPATPREIVGGKALAGMAFGLVAALIGLVVFRALFVHMSVAVIAMLLVVLLGVAVGLLLGTMFDDQGTMNLWLGLILMALVMPVGLLVMPRLAHLGDSWWYRFLPSVALARMLQSAMTETVPVGAVLASAALATAVIGLVLALVAWGIRRRQV